MKIIYLFGVYKKINNRIRNYVYIFSLDFLLKLRIKMHNTFEKAKENVLDKLFSENQTPAISDFYNSDFIYISEKIKKFTTNKF